MGFGKRLITKFRKARRKKRRSHYLAKNDETGYLVMNGETGMLVMRYKG